MTDVNEDFSSVVNYLGLRGYEVIPIPLFDTRFADRPAQLHAKIGHHAKVLYCCTTTDPRIKHIAAFTELHYVASSRSDHWMHDVNAVVAFRGQDADDFTFVTPSSIARATVLVNTGTEQKLSCAWGESYRTDYELIFGGNLQVNGWQESMMKGSVTYPSLPRIGQFTVWEFAAFAVMGHPGKTVLSEKIERLTPFFALNPHFRREDLSILLAMSRHRLQSSVSISKHDQDPAKIIQHLKHTGAFQLSLPGVIIPRLDLPVLLRDTGVSILRVRNPVRSDAVQTLAAAFLSRKMFPVLLFFKSRSPMNRLMHSVSSCRPNRHDSKR